MLKLKIEVFFSILLMLFSIMMMTSFSYFLLNNCSYIISWEVISVSSMFIELEVLFDWVSCSFSGLVCLISGSVCLFSINYMEGDVNNKRFIIVLMLFVISMNFLIFIPSFVSLILGWDGLGLVSFCLVIYYQNKKSLSAGLLTVLMNRVGDCFILGGVSIMMILGHYNYLCIWNFNYLELCMFFIIIAGMTKSAQIPFSSWLPAAMAAPTPVSALVHSSTLVTAGVYLLFRFYDTIFILNFFSSLLLFISIITTFMSGVCAIYEFDMKKIIALSTLSQLGVMMMALSMGVPMLALFHLYTHALFKALLFLCGGHIIYSYSGVQDIRDIKGVIYLLPITSVIMNIANMGLCGFPFLAGFYSKDMIIELLLENPMNMFMGGLGVLGVCLTLLYSMRMSIFIMWGLGGLTYVSLENEKLLTLISMFPLCLGAIMGGWVFQNIVISFNKIIILPQMYKMLVMFMLIFSLLISLSLWVGKGNKEDLNSFVWMNSKMWFFPILSTYPFIKSVKGVANKNLKIIDMGWMEIMSGQGIFMLLVKMLMLMEWWMLILFNMHFFFFFFLIVC
uniref:NADH dehydrogenase subunit 5 n=1 Tax=Amphitretus pelagicus TaxID=168639 RepID=UPI00226CBB14|nr:NADH dehydrogenase subunit 5 [Amphitretus pelagicus]UZN92545.1 NADH dehydrogenase subunit 5 [Amphitretus pelagicus]